MTDAALADWLPSWQVLPAGMVRRNCVKTETPSAQEALDSREWRVVDATGKTLGRPATEIATVLRGKHKPTFSPNLDSGDFVVVVNCERIVVTGDKLDTVRYYRHSRYPGGLKSRSMREQMQRFPDRVIYAAVRGMMPKTKLGRAQMKKLRIYAGPEHPHTAQQPTALEL
jgi:large subunit ribosomal protein L13